MNNEQLFTIILYYSLSRMTLHLKTRRCTLSERDLIAKKVQTHMTQTIDVMS